MLLREWGRRYEHIYVLDEDEPQIPVGTDLPFAGGGLTGEPMVPYSA